MPTSPRTRRMSTSGSSTCTPSTTTFPEAVVSSRLMQRISVLLPEPDGPLTATTSPRSMVRSMSPKVIVSSHSQLLPCHPVDWE